MVPVKATTTAELIKAIETHVMPHNGYIEVMIHDQGAAYTSKAFKDYAKARNITLNPVAKGNHRANGLAEKLVRQVHEGINKLADKDFKNWPKLLPIVEFNLRTSPNSETGITPAMAMLGRELKKGVLEIQPSGETALDEREHREKRKAAQDAMKKISSILRNPTRPRGELKGKSYKAGETVRIHRGPS